MCDSVVAASMVVDFVVAAVAVAVAVALALMVGAIAAVAAEVWGRRRCRCWQCRQ